MKESIATGLAVLVYGLLCVGLGYTYGNVTGAEAQAKRDCADMRNGTYTISHDGIKRCEW